MKKIFLFLAVASTAVFTSCSSDDNSDGGGAVAATSIVLASNVTAIEVGQSATFTVTDNLNNIVTGSSTLMANDVALTSATFTPTTAGTFEVKATYKNSKNVILTSNPITIVVTAVPTLPARYIQYNGTTINATAGDMIYWGAYYTDQTQTDIVEIFALATHDGDLSASNPENYAFVDFTIPVIDNQGNDVVAGSYNWVSPFTGLREIQLNLSGEEVEIDQTSYSAVTVNIDSIEIAAGGSVTMKYSTTAAWGTNSLNTAGNGAGFIFDASQSKSGKKEVFNLAKFNAKKAQFLSANVKMLKK